MIKFLRKLNFYYQGNESDKKDIIYTNMHSHRCCHQFKLSFISYISCFILYLVKLVIVSLLVYYDEYQTDGMPQFLARVWLMMNCVVDIILVFCIEYVFFKFMRWEDKQYLNRFIGLSFFWWIMCFGTIMLGVMIYLNNHNEISQLNKIAMQLTMTWILIHLVNIIMAIMIVITLYRLVT